MTFSVDGLGQGPGGTDAVVANGTFWFPGLGAGELYIDVVPTEVEPFTAFTLKEFPVPEPATCLLVVLGGLVLARRR